jgi:phytoene dehydrogenase-like protein
VTISIHTTEDEWDLSGEAYAEKKEQYKNLIWQHFRQTFPQISAEKFLTAGTPKTFYHYTLRPGGRVGGLPHRWSYPLWLWPSQFKRDGLSQLGDTVFPGQGLVATITGSMQWWRKMKAKLF